MLVKEYCDLLGIAKTGITQRLKNNNPPKAIKSYRKIGNTYDLVVDMEEVKKILDTRAKNGGRSTEDM